MCFVPGKCQVFRATRIESLALVLVYMRENIKSSEPFVVVTLSRDVLRSEEALSSQSQFFSYSEQQYASLRGNLSGE